MSPSWVKLASILGLALGAAAQSVTSTDTAASYTWTTTTKTKTTSQCSVVLGASTPGPVSTVSNTVSQHFPVTRRSWTTPTVTTTPAPVTVYANTTKIYTSYITVLSSTDLIKETTFTIETINKAASTTVTSTVTANSTTLIAPATVTVQPSPGFIPLASAVAAKQTTLAKRGAEPVSPAFQQKILYNGSMKPESFPSQVVCNTLIQYIEVRIRVAIAAPVVRAAACSTSTSTTTVTSSIVSTIVSYSADSTTIFTFSSATILYASATSTSTKTVVNTVTKTNTALATPTYYAACNSSNVVSSVTINGKVEGVSDVYLARAPGRLYTKNAYDCCVACINSNNCAFSQFFSVLKSDNCYLARKGNAKNNDPTEIGGQFYVSSKVNDGVSFLSNSNKGQVVFLGEQPDKDFITTSYATGAKTATSFQTSASRTGSGLTPTSASGLGSGVTPTSASGSGSGVSPTSASGPGSDDATSTSSGSYATATSYYDFDTGNKHVSPATTTALTMSSTSTTAATLPTGPLYGYYGNKGGNGGKGGHGGKGGKGGKGAKGGKGKKGKDRFRQKTPKRPCPHEKNGKTKRHSKKIHA